MGCLCLGYSVLCTVPLCSYVFENHRNVYQPKCQIWNTLAEVWALFPEDIAQKGAARRKRTKGTFKPHLCPPCSGLLQKPAYPKELLCFMSAYPQLDLWAILEQQRMPIEMCTVGPPGPLLSKDHFPAYPLSLSTWFLYQKTVSMTYLASFMAL